MSTSDLDYWQHMANFNTKPVESSPADHSDRATFTTQRVCTRENATHTNADPVSKTVRDDVCFNSNGTVDPVAGHFLPEESQWDHLWHWQDISDDVELSMEISDESEDDDDECDSCDSFEDATNDYDGQKVYTEPIECEASGQSRPSRGQIVAIINECIEHYTSLWTPNKEVLKEDQIHYDTEKMWLEAEAAGTRQQLIIKHETELIYYRQRLDRLCDEILSFPASSVEKVRHQCSSLEITINSMELADWLSSIYRLEPDSDGEAELGNDDNDYSDPSIHSCQSAPLTSLLDDHGKPSTEFVVRGSITGDVPNVKNGSVSSMQSRPCSDLLYMRDRKRFISQIIHEMDEGERALISHRLKHVSSVDLAREIAICVEMLRNGESKLPGVLPRDLQKIMSATRLYFSWWFGISLGQEISMDDKVEELRQCLRAGSSDPHIFYDHVRDVMAAISGDASTHPHELA